MCRIVDNQTLYERSSKIEKELLYNYYFLKNVSVKSRKYPEHFTNCFPPEGETRLHKVVLQLHAFLKCYC